MPKRFALPVCLAAALSVSGLAGCGGGDSSPGERTPDPAPNPTDQGGDTSGYQGRVAWVPVGLLGSQALRVWDLADSEFLVALSAEEEQVLSFYTPVLSADGGSLAYATMAAHPTLLAVLQSHVVDLTSGNTVGIPTETGTPGETRLSRLPSLSGDGTAIAFVQEIGGVAESGLPETREVSLAVWSPGQAQPQALTGDDRKLDCPRLDAAGTTVVYLSDGKFHQVSVDGGAPPEAIVLGDAGITGVDASRRFGCPFDLSADGNSVAFVGTTAGNGRTLFVADTATGAVMPLASHTSTHSLGGFSMSADGQRVVWKTSETINEGTTEIDIIVRLHGVDLADPDTVFTIREASLLADQAPLLTAVPVLSRDGETIADVIITSGAAHPHALAVMRFDGAEVRLVTTDASAVGIGTLDLAF